MSSTRTELCGLFAAITHLRLVVEYNGIIPNKNVSYRIYCDGKAALARAVDEYYDGFGRTWRYRTHYDHTLRYGPAFYSCQSPILSLGASSCEAQEVARGVHIS
jgi:hypothetical protein